MLYTNIGHFILVLIRIGMELNRSIINVKVNGLNKLLFYTLIRHILITFCRYVECTSSAVQALVLFKKLHPEYRRKEVERCISKGIQFIEAEQEPDGSWYVCT